MFFCLSLLFCSFLFSVTENKESALEAQNQLREEILGKLEETNKSIDQVFAWNEENFSFASRSVGTLPVALMGSQVSQKRADELENDEWCWWCAKGKLVDGEEKREAGVVEVDLSLENLERRVEERLNQKVNYLLEKLDSAVQVHLLIKNDNFSWSISGYGAEPGEPGDGNEELQGGDGRGPGQVISLLWFIFLMFYHDKATKVWFSCRGGLLKG